jgi:hypothetical protein
VAGIAFCAVDGDVVVDGGVQLRQEEQGRVRVTLRHRRGERPADAGEANLGAAADALGLVGWDALLYRAGRTRYLLIEPDRS